MKKWAKNTNAELYADAGFVPCIEFAPNLLNVVKLSACREFILRFSTSLCGLNLVDSISPLCAHLIWK